MRLLDDEKNIKLDTISIFLTQKEITELIGYLEDLLSHKDNSHVHMSNHDFQKEITLCKYNPDHLDNLHPRAKKLILEDE